MTAADETPAQPDGEATCRRCGGPNITWCAPSPLWNEVMRGGDINGPWQFDEIICPVCFAVLAEAAGIAELWRFTAERVNWKLQTVTPSGRTWNETTWLWDDARPAAVADQADALDLDAIRARLRRALDEVCGLADGSRKWTMRIPADETRDSDLVISVSLDDLDELLPEYEQLLAELAEARAENERIKFETSKAYHQRDEIREDYRAAEKAGNAQLAKLSRERGEAIVRATKAESERDEARAKAVDGGEQLRYAHTRTLDVGQWEIRVTCVDQDCFHGDRCEHAKVHTHVWRSPWRPGGHYEERTGRAVCPDGVVSDLRFGGGHHPVEAVGDDGSGT